jgi:dTDP-4-dehydrorhamnose 3,5-epimerase-like enzyme
MLMKGSSKRKRTKEELEEVKHEEEAMRGDVQGYLTEVKRMKQEHAEMLAFLQNNQNQPQMNPGDGGMMQ